MAGCPRAKRGEKGNRNDINKRNITSFNNHLQPCFECKDATLKNALTVRLLTRSIISLFDTKKQLATYKRLPYAYHKHVYVPKNLYDGIDLVARIENISKKKATEKLLEAGFSRYMGEKIKEHVENEQRITELNLKRHPSPTRFVKEVRKYCKERGMDISKII